MINYDRLGQDIAAKRKVKNIGLRECAKEIGVSAPTLSRVENGQKLMLETYVLICRWLDCEFGQYILKHGHNHVSISDPIFVYEYDTDNDSVETIHFTVFELIPEDDSFDCHRIIHRIIKTYTDPEKEREVIYWVPGNSLCVFTNELETLEKQIGIKIINRS